MSKKALNQKLAQRRKRTLKNTRFNWITPVNTVITLLIALAGLLTAVNQTLLFKEQVSIEKLSYKPIITSQNEFWSTSGESNSLYLSENHALKFLAEPDLIRHVAIQNVSVVGVIFTRQGFGTKLFEIPLDGYFFFCSDELEAGSRSIGTCYGENNAKFDLELQAELEKIQNSSNKYLRISGIRNYSKIRFKTKIGSQETDYILTTSFGMTDETGIEEKFEWLLRQRQLGKYLSRDAKYSDIKSQIQDIYSVSLPLDPDQTPAN